MSGFNLRHLFCLLPVLLLQVGHSVEQGNRNLFQQPYRGTTSLADRRSQQEVLQQQQVIVPGGFQQQFQGNFPSLRTIDTRNTRVIPSIQNGHFQLRNPGLSPNPTAQQRSYSPLLTGSNLGQRQSQLSQNSGQDLRPGETQYEYYDDADGDVVYHYSNEDGETSGGSGSSGPSVSKSILPTERRNKLQRSQRPSQTSSFIPLVEDEEPLGQGLAFKGRSVQPQASLRNSAFGGNPTPLPGLLRNTSIIARSRSTPPSPPPPAQPLITKRPAVLRGPVNRFTLTSRPQISSGSRTVPSLPPSKSSDPIQSGKTAEAPPGEEEYEEYEDGDAYYEEEEVKGKPEGDKSSETTKTKVTVSVSTKTSSTTPPPPVVSRPRATPAPGIVISVATTRSIADKGSRGLRGSTPPPPTTPKVTFSRATGSSIVVASVQTSRSVGTPSSSQPRLISSQHPPQDSSKEPEYYEEEYPENYPVLNGSPLGGAKPSEPTLPSPSPTESIMDKLDRVQSELVNGVLQGIQSSKPPLSSPTSQSREVEDAPIPPNVESQKKSLNLIAEPDPPTEEIKGVDNLFKNLKFKDLSSLLPADYKSSTPPAISTTTTVASTTTTTTTTTSPSTEKPESSSTLNSLLATIKFEEAALSALLPKGYKPTFSPPKENKVIIPSSTTTTTTTTTTPPPPPSTSTKPKISLDSLLSKVKLSDISALLPPGYDESRFSSTSSPSSPSSTTTTTTDKPGTVLGGVVIPNVKFDDVSKFLPPGYKPPPTFTSAAPPTSPAITTVASTSEGAVTTPKPLNKLVFPTRPGGLKFTRPSSTEAPKADAPLLPKVTIQKGGPQRKTTEFTGWPTSSTLPTVYTSTSTEATTTTTTTTTTTERPTTTTLPPKRSPLTACNIPFCKMEAVLRIVGFRWKPEYGDINTEEWKHLERTVKRELDAAYRSSGLAQYYRSVEIEGFTKGSVIVDYFVILENVTTNLTSSDVRALFHGSLPPSDQHDFSADNVEVDKVAIAADERLRLGRYIIDPKYTDFKVRNQTNEIHGASASEGIIPQWGIAVIVIGLASLMFVVIFGVTVLVNRHRNSKKKNAVSLTQEMLSEFNKTHSYGVDNYGADDLYNMDDVWNDKQPPHMDRTFDRKPGKRASSSGKGSANYNIYDSWKTEWNGYYYNGNYYGDSGYAPSRRRSDYDTNF